MDEVRSISEKSAVDHDEQHDEAHCIHSWQDFPDELGFMCECELNGHRTTLNVQQ